MRRYDRKDYTLVVEFPVEIVGRDGVVRRYSFEDSVRLYQRRIASANQRYADHDVVGAEVAHCRRRIEQLRRSYFARYGWSSLQRMSGSHLLDDGLAGEVAAFLRRCVEGSETDPETFQFASVEREDDRQTFFIQPVLAAPTDNSEHFLLYLFRFNGPEACPARDAFFGQLKVLQSVRNGGDSVEALLAFHHTADCGLVLTGQPGTLPGRPDDPIEALDLRTMAGEPADDPQFVGIALLRQGRAEDALDALMRAQEENPWRHAAGVSATVVADALGDASSMETAALIGVRTFPKDPVFLHNLAVARLRLGELRDADESLRESIRIGGDSAEGSVVGALLALRAGRGHRARVHLRRARRLETADGADLEPARRQAFGVAGAIVGSDLGALTLAVVGLIWGGAAGMALAVGVGALLTLGMRVGLSRYLAARLRGPSSHRLARATRPTEGSQ